MGSNTRVSFLEILILVLLLILFLLLLLHLRLPEVIGKPKSREVPRVVHCSMPMGLLPAPHTTTKLYYIN